MRAAFRPVAAGPDLLYSDGGTAAPRSTSEKNTKRTQFLTTNAESTGYDGFSNTVGPPAQRYLTDRSGGIRGDFELSPVAQASAAVGYNGNAARTLSVGPGRDKQSCLSSRRQAAR